MPKYPELTVKPSEVSPGDVIAWEGSTSGAVAIGVEPSPEGTVITIVWHSMVTGAWHNARLGRWPDDEPVQLVYRYLS